MSEDLRHQRVTELTTTMARCGSGDGTGPRRTIGNPLLDPRTVRHTEVGAAGTDHKQDWRTWSQKTCQHIAANLAQGEQVVKVMRELEVQKTKATDAQQREAALDGPT